ncbi:MAG: hypothetical protein ABIG11_01120 [bacterium]
MPKSTESMDSNFSGNLLFRMKILSIFIPKLYNKNAKSFHPSSSRTARAIPAIDAGRHKEVIDIL